MEGGCLGYPGASTVGSQLLDRIPPPWLANPLNPAMSPHSRHPSTLIESVEGKKQGRVGGGTLKNTGPKRSKTAEEGRRIPLEGITLKTIHYTLQMAIRLSTEAETKLRLSMWACTLEVDCWPEMPAN